MKEVFFKGLVVALPIVVISGLVYAIFLGFYQLYSDMQLKRELKQIEREAKDRRRREAVDAEQESQTFTVEDYFK